MQHEKHTKKTRKKFKLANIFLVKQTQIIMLFKLEMESLDFRQWQNKKGKRPNEINGEAKKHPTMQKGKEEKSTKS